MRIIMVPEAKRRVPSIIYLISKVEYRQGVRRSQLSVSIK